MTAVYCFSGTGHSRDVAAFFAEKLHTAVLSMDDPPLSADTAVVVFPVYCQNIPAPAKDFLALLSAKYVVLIAVHGGISGGRTLYEAAQRTSGIVIAGAYVSSGHTFLGGASSFDSAALLPILDRIENPQKVRLPKTKKIWYANLFPGWRSRRSVRLIRSSRCTGCGLCEKQCPAGAMRPGKPNGKCIRCLHCTTVCPQNALTFRTHPLLQRYLRRRTRQTKPELWL